MVTDAGNRRSQSRSRSIDREEATAAPKVECFCVEGLLPHDDNVSLVWSTTIDKSLLAWETAASKAGGLGPVSAVGPVIYWDFEHRQPKVSRLDDMGSELTDPFGGLVAGALLHDVRRTDHRPQHCPDVACPCLDYRSFYPLWANQLSESADRSGGQVLVWGGGTTAAAPPEWGSSS